MKLSRGEMYRFLFRSMAPSYRRLILFEMIVVAEHLCAARHLAGAAEGVGGGAVAVELGQEGIGCERVLLTSETPR